jgi:GNAT superfamily N-acetyltransferase
MSTSELVIETNPTPEQIQYLEDRLYEFNAKATGITDGQGLAIFVRDEQDRIVAGICGHIWGGCCEIRQLWVEESRRRRGLGTRLLRVAEQEARRRHCKQMVLTTSASKRQSFTQSVDFTCWLLWTTTPMVTRICCCRKSSSVVAEPANHALQRTGGERGGSLGVGSVERQW